MLAMQCVSVPIKFASSFQTNGERAAFQKEVARSERFEQQLIKEGFTPTGEPERKVIGDIEYEFRMYSHQPTIEDLEKAG